MRNEKQIEAGRLNAAKSSGPRSAEAFDREERGDLTYSDNGPGGAFQRAQSRMIDNARRTVLLMLDRLPLWDRRFRRPKRLLTPPMPLPNPLNLQPLHLSSGSFRHFPKTRRRPSGPWPSAPGLMLQFRRNYPNLEARWHRLRLSTPLLPTNRRSRTE
jgi:hypothetical protein